MSSRLICVLVIVALLTSALTLAASSAGAGTKARPMLEVTTSRTAESYYIIGYVRTTDGEGPLAGVTVSLYRQDSGIWELVAQRTTDPTGHFAFGVSYISLPHRIVETDPPGYVSDRAELPRWLNGTVVDPNTVQYSLLTAPTQIVGPFIFYDRLAPTATPTATATPTDTPTVTPTETATPTATPVRFGLWLPVIIG